ncbi:unnamed protein product [Ectocarpus sp. CCAP 1310/34]|nr:unnamed protein product [Ectocarpus sp. CCAP 1310/34]
MSMISKMVFRTRLRWVTEAPPTFGRRNRISNVMLRTARGKPPPVGSPETGDAGELLRALNGGGMDDLNEKTLDDLKNIYRLCFPGGRGISAYTKKEDFIGCFQQLWRFALGPDEADRCSKVFIVRPSGKTAGVEGLFTPDGVVNSHLLQVTSESPADVVDTMRHLAVRNRASARTAKEGVPTPSPHILFPTTAR